MEGTLVQLFLEWKPFFLLIVVLGTGYLSLLVVETLKCGKIYKIPLYDKIIMSLLFGFFNLEYMLYISNEVFLKSNNDILILIGIKGGPLFFIINLFFSVALGYSSYLLFYKTKIILNKHYLN